MSPLWLLLLGLAPQEEVVVVDRDGVEIARSCAVEVRGEAIADAAGDGVVRIATDGVTVDFGGARLHGAAAGILPDAYAGVGILVEARGVTLRNARVSGYKVGILARGADGLVLEDCDVSDNFRQRLRSTPRAEAGSDWLRPHDNEQSKWVDRYGAGICIERSRGIEVRRCRARDGQNGLILDRVVASRVYDNDFSFLSGWGIALWRASDNLISRNALDFCVRGYSHGVYNRGQDSAGILMFEQCCRNVIAENSATHGGDGFFGFAGSEALGQAGSEAEPAEHLRRGCNDNLLVDNDFSYAPAHGIEMTFSFGNRFLRNRLVENAICGVWGGYSRDTLIALNEFLDNGYAGYGLERGGVNIEHGQRNRILQNHFDGNSCGVHLWWDEDVHFQEVPWARANGMEVSDNVVAGNDFFAAGPILHLRQAPRTFFLNNTHMDVGGPIVDCERAEDLLESGNPDLHWVLPEWEVFGETRPVGARPELEGRDKILMTEWGPYDWQSALPMCEREHPGGHLWWVMGAGGPLSETSAHGPVELAPGGGGEWPVGHVVTPMERSSICAYEMRFGPESGALPRQTLMVDATWNISVFPWLTDPRKDVETWREEGRRYPDFEADRLDLVYGGDGPSQLAGVPERIVNAFLPRDHFGTRAETTLSVLRGEIPLGRCRLTTLSDDGVRVWVNDELVIDNWTWHVPTEDSAIIDLTELSKLHIRVEHFELDGYSVLSLDLEPVD